MGRVSTKLQLLTIIAIFSWSASTSAETKTIVMRGKQHEAQSHVQDDRPILLQIGEGVINPMAKSISKPVTDSMNYILDRNLKEYRLDNEFRKLYKPTETCKRAVREDKESVKRVCDELYIKARTKYAKDKGYR